MDAPQTPGTTVVPLGPTSYAVLRTPYDEARPAPSLIVRPADLVAIVLDGTTVARDGRPLVGPGAAEAGDWVGDWRDDAQDMTQHLRGDGRYSETRSGRVDAWTGRWWSRGAEIVYLDDTGFWAYGVQTGGVLVHAHFRLVRDGATQTSQR